MVSRQAAVAGQWQGASTALHLAALEMQQAQTKSHQQASASEGLT